MFKWLWDKIVNFFYDLTYYIGTFFLRILKMLDQMFRVFAGTKTVHYGDSDEYLVNIFFTNNTVTTLYAGMALIGIVILIVMTIFAVAKKSVDVDDKIQSSLGSTLRKLLSGFLLIISMNFIMIVTINFSNTLMQSIEYLFDNAHAISENNSITFTDKQYAAMARIYNTIGNYSLNDSYRSRYNINSCFNEIRGDMTYLEAEGVFRYTYTENTDGEQVDSWQSVLSAIARAHDVSKDLPLDEYDESVSEAVLAAMEFAKRNNNEMTVLQSYSRQAYASGPSGATVDVTLFLCATSHAARNKKYNEGSVSFVDAVRGQYTSGAKSIYDINTVKKDFSLAFSSFDHLVVIIGGIIMCKEFFALCINCVARLFNMLLLYLVAPPIIATSPSDDGAKFKQWKTAFVIQCFNVFGTVISIRLLLLLFPIIFDSNLTLVGSGLTEMIAKVVLLIGAVYTARKANGLISGILAENAGYQSIMAGDAASAVKNSGFGKFYEGAKEAAATVGTGVLKGGLKAAGAVAKAPFSAVKAGFNRLRGGGSGSANGKGASPQGKKGASPDKSTAPDGTSPDKGGNIGPNLNGTAERGTVNQNNQTSQQGSNVNQNSNNQNSQQSNVNQGPSTDSSNEVQNGGELKNLNNQNNNQSNQNNNSESNASQEQKNQEKGPNPASNLKQTTLDSFIQKGGTAAQNNLKNNAPENISNSAEGSKVQGGGEVVNNTNVNQGGNVPSEKKAVQNNLKQSAPDNVSMKVEKPPVNFNRKEGQ